MFPITHHKANRTRPFTIQIRHPFAMPPSAFRQDHFLNSLIQGVETESAVRAELSQKAEDRGDLSKAVSRKNAVAASSEQIEPV